MKLKKSGFAVLLTVILATVMGTFTACDTTLFYDEVFPISTVFQYGGAVSADGRYLITDFRNLYDLTENASIPLQYGIDEPKQGVLYFAGIGYADEQGTTAVAVNAWLEMTYFKVEDGTLDRHEYLPMTYVFDTAGSLLRADSTGEAMSEADFRAVYDPHVRVGKPSTATEGIENLENYDISNSVYEDRRHDPNADPALSALETLLLEKVFACEHIPYTPKQQADTAEIDGTADGTDTDGTPDTQSFYQFDINARRIGDKVWFSYRYCNKKNFMSQHSVKSGYRSSALLCYDEASGTFTEVMRLGKQTCIMAYSETHVIYYRNDKLICRTLATDEDTVLLRNLPSTVRAKAFADRVEITAGDRIYIYTLDGTLLLEK